MRPRPLLIIINSNYPSETNKYGDVFVHSRVKLYKAHLDVEIVGWKKDVKDYTFNYEGVTVHMVDSKSKLVEKVKALSPDVVGIHFVEGWMKDNILRLNVPFFIWIHGAEALGWYRRIYLITSLRYTQFIKYCLLNTLQMLRMNQIIRYAHKTGKIKFIFVSKWMRSIAETDTLSTVTNSHIIPNPINTDLFTYREKKADLRKKILVIRSFDSKKYATDQIVQAIIKLSGKPFFTDLSFTIYGDGRLFDEQTAPLKNFNNVELHKRFLENKDLPALHSGFGIFLCPTRQDAQGVSMCEAMSSGLVPITSNNTAIPEFVKHNETGFLTNGVAEIVTSIEKLYHEPEVFLKMSLSASQSIANQCSHRKIIQQEVDLIFSSLKK